jgi:hypothetical protein
MHHFEYNRLLSRVHPAYRSSSVHTNSQSNSVRSKSSKQTSSTKTNSKNKPLIERLGTISYDEFKQIYNPLDWWNVAMHINATDFKNQKNKDLISKHIMERFFVSDVTIENVLNSIEKYFDHKMLNYINIDTGSDVDALIKASIHHKTKIKFRPFMYSFFKKMVNTFEDSIYKFANKDFFEFLCRNSASTLLYKIIKKTGYVIPQKKQYSPIINNLLHISIMNKFRKIKEYIPSLAKKKGDPAIKKALRKHTNVFNKYVKPILDKIGQPTYANIKDDVNKLKEEIKQKFESGSNHIDKKGYSFTPYMKLVKSKNTIVYKLGVEDGKYIFTDEKEQIISEGNFRKRTFTKGVRALCASVLKHASERKDNSINAIVFIKFDTSIFDSQYQNSLHQNIFVIRIINETAETYAYEPHGIDTLHKPTQLFQTIAVSELKSKKYDTRIYSLNSAGLQYLANEHDHDMCFMICVVIAFHTGLLLRRKDTTSVDLRTIEHFYISVILNAPDMFLQGGHFLLLLRGPIDWERGKHEVEYIVHIWSIFDVLEKLTDRKTIDGLQYAVFNFIFLANKALVTKYPNLVQKSVSIDSLTGITPPQGTQSATDGSKKKKSSKKSSAKKSSAKKIVVRHRQRKSIDLSPDKRQTNSTNRNNRSRSGRT